MTTHREEWTDHRAAADAALTDGLVRTGALHALLAIHDLLDRRLPRQFDAFLRESLADPEVRAGFEASVASDGRRAGLLGPAVAVGDGTMNAEHLRDAAAYLRQPDRTSVTDYDEALADWLDETARWVPVLPEPIAVADAVLGGRRSKSPVCGACGSVISRDEEHTTSPTVGDVHTGLDACERAWAREQSDHIDRAAEVVAAHVGERARGGTATGAYVRCSCGLIVGGSGRDHATAKHHAHVARALDAAGLLRRADDPQVEIISTPSGKTGRVMRDGVTVFNGTSLEQHITTEGGDPDE